MLLTTLALAMAAVGQGPADWYEPFPAHKVVGNVYYVGSKDLATFLITTPEGHILINSGFDRTVPLIQKSVESLGFKMTDVKILLASHAHSDHVAGHALLQKADRRQGLCHARRRPGHRFGRQGPIHVHDQPLGAVQGRPRSGGSRRSQTWGRHACRSSDARPHAWLHHVDLARRGRRQEI